MVFVKVRDAEHLEEAIKRFKRECEKNGILREIKRRETYTPPSVKRKLKSEEAQRRARRTKRRRFYVSNLSGNSPCNTGLLPYLPFV